MAGKECDISKTGSFWEMVKNNYFGGIGSKKHLELSKHIGLLYGDFIGTLDREKVKAMILEPIGEPINYIDILLSLLEIGYELGLVEKCGEISEELVSSYKNQGIFKPTVTKDDVIPLLKIGAEFREIEPFAEYVNMPEIKEKLIY